MSWRGFGSWSLTLLALGTCLCAHAATASLQDDQQLVALLTKSPQCCVIDARSAQHRKQAELPGALLYSDPLRIKPSSGTCQ